VNISELILVPVFACRSKKPDRTGLSNTSSEEPPPPVEIDGDLEYEIKVILDL